MSKRPLSPPAFAKRYGVNPDKVHTWIRNGELAAIDVSTKPTGRPRWRIMPEAVEAFEARRAAKPPAPKPKRRRRTSTDPVVEYV